MKFSDFQDDMKKDPDLKIKRVIWPDIYIHWDDQQLVFNEHTPESDKVWDWNGETTTYEDLNADDWILY